MNVLTHLYLNILKDTQLSADLLQWYDYHKRVLPWRSSSPHPDPYHVWLSEVMLQQTTVTVVKPYFEKFIQHYPTILSLSQAKLDEVLSLWAGLGYYSRARNLHACAQKIIEHHRGSFPQNRKDLLKLPGIGDYTAGAILSIAFGLKEIAIDGNVERVLSRLLNHTGLFPAARKDIELALSKFLPDDRAGDFLQALMDLGSSLCTPRRPACGLCPWREKCRGFRFGSPETLPRKAPKIKKEIRKGALFIAERADGALLLENRPLHGLLGGMAQFPGSLWTPDYNLSRAMLDAPIDARWKKQENSIKHIFSHFRLELTIYYAKLPVSTEPPEGMRFTSLERIDKEPLPSVMKKAYYAVFPQANKVKTK